MLDFLASDAVRVLVIAAILLVFVAGAVVLMRRGRPVEAGAGGGGAAVLERSAAAERPMPRPVGQAPGQALPEAADAGVPLAVLEFEDAPGRVVVSKPSVVIGRHSTDDVRVNDIRVSRHHALLARTPMGAFEIHNQTAVRAEPNDLLVNGVYREHAELQDGDVVTLGGVSFVFRDAERNAA